MDDFVASEGCNWRFGPCHIVLAGSGLAAAGVDNWEGGARVQPREPELHPGRLGLRSRELLGRTCNPTTAGSSACVAGDHRSSIDSRPEPPGHDAPEPAHGTSGPLVPIGANGLSVPCRASLRSTLRCAALSLPLFLLFLFLFLLLILILLIQLVSRQWRRERIAHLPRLAHVARVGRAVDVTPQLLLPREVLAD